jgi:hypothetical protein
MAETSGQLDCVGYLIHRNGSLPLIELKANAEKLDVLRQSQFGLYQVQPELADS